MNILIAEDSLMLQRLYSELMKGWGYEFDIAANGMEAIAFVKNNNGNYDLCLMDIEMPIMDGIEATRIIRKISSYFPIMAITANDIYKKACYDVGMDDFVLKPCLPDELSSKINALSVKSYKLY